MNTYKKYCPNVFVAQCEEEHEKGDVIIIDTKYGKENEHIVHNKVFEKNGLFYYSITRADGFTNQERAKNRAEKLESWASSAEKRSNEWMEKINEGRNFLSLGEPIKVGHHSEKGHRALIERNWNRMSNAMNELEKAEAYRQRTGYWERLAEKIDLSMPESIEFFQIQLEEAIEYQKGLKDGSIKRDHSFSLPYATKRVKELKDKYETAVKLWA